MIAAMRNIDAIKQDNRPNNAPAINVTFGCASGRFSRGAGTSGRAQQLPNAPPVQALSSQPQIPPPLPQQPFDTDVVMRLVAERYGLVPIQQLQQPPVPPRAHIIQRPPQPEFRVRNFSYDNAVTFLRLPQPEMAERHLLKMCATCVNRVPLHSVKTALGRNRI